MTKIIVKSNGYKELKYNKLNRVYKDNHFIIFHWYRSDKIWVSNNVDCKDIGDLPDYIKQEITKELI